MTSHPTAQNSLCWWLCCGKWRRLHAIPGELVSLERMRDAIDDAELVPARAVCGLYRRWVMPGVGSRLGLARCAACCGVLGIPPGWGTPANGG